MKAERFSLMSLALLMVLSLGLTQCHDTGRKASMPAGPGLEHGIEVLGVELMAGGDLARLNYRVTDYEKAKRALAGGIQLYASGDTRALAVTDVGRLGPMRQRPSRSGVKQFIMFTNSGRMLRSGTTAVLGIGPDRIPDIPVS